MDEGSELIIRCREIHDIAQQARSILHSTISSVGGQQKIYTFKDRTKSPKAIWLKVHRNRHEAVERRVQHATLLRSTDASNATKRLQIGSEIAAQESFGADNVWDAWGCRYVTLFEDQRSTLVSDLFQTLEAFIDAPVTLLRCSIFYTEGSPGSKDRAVEIKNRLCDPEFAPKVIVDRKVIQDPELRNGYSSVHFNFAVPIIMDFPRGDKPPRVQQSYREVAVFEVQVRDIFEEAWSEAEHFLFYSHKDEGIAPSANESQELQRAKELVDANRGTIDTTRYWISKIKQHIDGARSRSAPNVEITSATSRADDKTEIVATISDKVSQETLDALGDAYSLLHDAENAKTKDEMRKNYGEATAKFKYVRDHLAKAADLRISTRGNMEVRYFIDIELANSYIFSEAADGATAATALFEELLKSYPDDPTLRYRYAKAMTRLRLPADYLSAAQKLVRDIPKLVRDDPLTGRRHWLSMAAAILDGYIHWCRARDLEKGQADE